MSARGISLRLLCAVLLTAIIFSPIHVTPPLWLRVSHDAAHGAIFAVITYSIYQLLRPRAALKAWSRGRHLTVSSVLALALALGTEIAQSFTQRDPTWGDLGRDGLGILLTLSLLTAHHQGPRKARTSAFITAAACLIAVLWPMLDVLQAYRARAQAHPQIATFDSPRATRFIEPRHASIEVVPLPAPWKTMTHESALHIRFGAGAWPGIHLLEPVQDWRRWRYVAVDLTNPTARPWEVGVRIDDTDSRGEPANVFVSQHRVEPKTRTTLRIELQSLRTVAGTRRLDTGRIESLAIFCETSGCVREAYVSGVWLE